MRRRLPACRWRAHVAAPAVLICLCATFCKPMPVPDEDVPPLDPLPLPNLLPTRSLQCFEDGQVYGCCEDAYRLSPWGVIPVPAHAVDYYCGRACVVETEDVLNCVASALDGFTFYNGASVEDVRYALRRGCSHGIRRGDFNDLEPHMGDYPDIFGDDDSSSSSTVAAGRPPKLLLLALLGGACLLLLLDPSR